MQQYINVFPYKCCKEGKKVLHYQIFLPNEHAKT